jgi:CubicO group peptidase (beta-lactamase class C family)
VLRKGYGYADQATNTPNTSATVYRIGNLSRPFTAASILLLERQGKLSVQDSICTYIDDCPAAWAPVTLHHVLSDSSGIPSYNEMQGCRELIGAQVAPDALIALVRDRPLRFTPGARWDLSQTNYALLGMVIERVSGQPYETFLQEQILTPLGMTATGYRGQPDGLATGYTVYNAGMPADAFEPTAAFAGYGLYSTVDDLYRWDQALFTDGLLAPAEREVMHSAHVNEGPWYLGYGTLLSDRYLPKHHRVFKGHPWLAYPGFYGSNWSLTDLDVTIIILANQAIANCLNDGVGAMILAEP